MIKYLLNLFFLTIFSCIVFSCTATAEASVDDDDIELPTVTTSQASQINQTTATSGGNVSDDGGSKITSRGICWSKTTNPTTASTTKTKVAGTIGAFESAITGLTANTLYYVRAYAVNEAGTAYGAQISFTTAKNAIALPTVTTSAATAIAQTTATVGGNVTNAGGAAVTERGICWSTSSNPTTASSKIKVTGTTGSFTGSLTGLAASTTYYAKAYAINSGGTAYGAQVTFTTKAVSNGPTDGKAVCNGTTPTTVVPITSSTGKVWMDRNLGASRAATSAKDFEAYGCLYQWGRGNDGHASITWTMGQEDAMSNPAGVAVNGTTATLSSSNTPPDALFIVKSSNRPYDWRSPKNDNLWQGVDGINNPCPTGYRLPTQAEFKAEITANSITGGNSAFSSVHKFPYAGNRAFDSGRIRGQGEEMWFWTSTGDFGDSYDVLIQPGAVYSNVANARASGYSVRCIKN